MKNKALLLEKKTPLVQLNLGKWFSSFILIHR